MPKDAVKQTQNDPLLLPFLDAKGKDEDLLARLLQEIAEPVIRGAVRQKLHVSLSRSDCSAQNQDGLDLLSSVRMLVISELRNLKINRDQRAIGDFRQYVAVKAYSACADYFRKKHPQRWSLKNAIRYQLKQDRRFALLEDERGKWVCSLRAWADSNSTDQSLRQRTESLDVQSLFPEGTAGWQQIALSELLKTILDGAGGPIELERLVVLVAELKGIKDHPPESVDQDRMLSESLISAGVAVDAALEQRLYLTRLWAEVCSLPALQRAALLLNLRDANSDSAIAFVPYLDIASKEEIAEVVGVPYERFCELWHELPLEDSAIALLLGVTRQQVINLRKTARERLARRMKAHDKSLSKSTGQR